MKSRLSLLSASQGIDRAVLWKSEGKNCAWLPILQLLASECLVEQSKDLVDVQRDVFEIESSDVLLTLLEQIVDLEVHFENCLFATFVMQCDKEGAGCR